MRWPARRPGRRRALRSFGGAGRETLAELERLVELLSADDPRRRSLETLRGQARGSNYTPLPDGVRVTPVLQDGAYRVVQEGLANAMKHARQAPMSRAPRCARACAGGGGARPGLGRTLAA